MAELKCWCGGVTKQGMDGLICTASRYHDPLATGRPEHVTVLYVAGPMSGYPDCNYPAFNTAAKYLEGCGYTVVNPASFGEGAHYVDFLREDLRLMLDCQGVAVLDYWWESTGARNEVNVAGLLKMPVRTVSEWAGLRTVSEWAGLRHYGGSQQRYERACEHAARAMLTGDAMAHARQLAERPRQEWSSNGRVPLPIPTLRPRS